MKIVLSENQFRYIANNILSEESNSVVDRAFQLKGEGGKQTGNLQADTRRAMAMYGLTPNSDGGSDDISNLEGEVDKYNGVEAQQTQNTAQGTTQTTVQQALTTIQQNTSNSSTLKSDIVWIGDSQSVVHNAKWPKGVLTGLRGYGRTYLYFAMGSARADHYIAGTKLKTPYSTNIKFNGNEGANDGQLCYRAYKVLLNANPKYCFIALGHNGTKMLGDLIKAFKNIGCKVVLVEEFTTNAKQGTGMKSYNVAASNSLYSPFVGMVDKVVNLITYSDGKEINIAKSDDGVHMSSQGADLAVQLSLQQLNKV